jgi:hypothetical protein
MGRCAYRTVNFETNHFPVSFTEAGQLLALLFQPCISFHCIIATFPHSDLQECRQMSKSMGWDFWVNPANILESSPLPLYFMVQCHRTFLSGVPPATDTATLQGGRNELRERGYSHLYTYISSRRIFPRVGIYPSSFTLSSQFTIPTSFHGHLFYTTTWSAVCIKASWSVQVSW